MVRYRYRVFGALCALLWSAGIALGQAGAGVSLQPAALESAGTYHLRRIEPGLTGEGVTIAAVCRSLTYVAGKPQDDYRPNVEHACFGNRDIHFADGLDVSGAVSFHSTAIGGILVGNDSRGFHPEAGSFHYEGAAPQCRVDVYEFWRFLSLYIYGSKDFQADILTMSVGSVFEDWWTRGIDRLAAEQGLLVFAGIGNGTDVHDPIFYPGAGSNVIGVGVVDSLKTGVVESLGRFALPRPERSSRGPTLDDRCKPDIVAPGNCLVPSAENSNEYEITGDWSSFATPVVAGTAALLVQKAGSDPLLSAAIDRDGGNCVMRAILMNSATKLPYWHKGNPGPEDDHVAVLDYQQGAGMLNAVGAYQQLAAGRGEPGEVLSTGWDNNVIEKKPGLEHVYTFSVAEPEGQMLTATLVWNRHYKPVYPFKSLREADSDLTLEVWAVDPENKERNRLLDYSDSINDNVEHIWCALDADYTRYEIVVTHSAISGDVEKYPSERYGLAWRTSLADGMENIFWYDLNLDGKVDADDLILLMNRFAESDKNATGYGPGDLDMSGVVDVADLTAFMTGMERLATGK